MSGRTKLEVCEIRSLTGLRGIAAVVVVLYHYYSHRLAGNLYLAVDLFFVLSGFVMTLNYGHFFEDGHTLKAVLQFLGRRIARVYPLYLVCTLVAFFWDGARGGYSHELFRVGALNLLMVQTWGLTQSLVGTGWSISAEWAAYLVFPLLVTAAMYRKPAWSWLLGASSVASLLMLCTLPHRLAGIQAPRFTLDFWLAAHALPVARCLPEFTLGILAARSLESSAGRWLAGRKWSAAILAVLILVLLPIPRSDLAFVLLIPPLLVTLARGQRWPANWLSSGVCHRLGVLSYGIYLIHIIVAPLNQHVHAWASSYGLSHAQSYAVAVSSLVTLGLAALAYRFIELPGRIWTRNLFEGRHLKTLVRSRPVLVEPR